MAKVAVITGSSGLVGSSVVRLFSQNGYRCIGIDNDMRQHFFGRETSTQWNARLLAQEVPGFVNHDIDIRDAAGLERIFAEHGANIGAVIHTAAQPSHDWAAREPLTDFSINATGTLHLLECARRHCPEAPFVFVSTNKVYGDLPNELPMEERPTRWEVSPSHHYAQHGIDETMSLDQSKHSLFGVSKVAADLLVQEYGRYFGMPTVCFRCGCLTGPAHSGAQLHGFLSYLVKCGVTGQPYTIFGYKGKQVRDNLHSADLADAFYQFCAAPKPAKVYNMGGSRANSCSILEAAQACEELTGQKLRTEYSKQARAGDHIWYLSDVRAFCADYPGWKIRIDLNTTLEQLVESYWTRVT